MAQTACLRYNGNMFLNRTGNAVYAPFGYAINETYPGVFVVTGAMIPIQIIDIRKLSDEENLWLRNLDRNLSGKNLLWAHGMKKKHAFFNRRSHTQDQAFRQMPMRVSRLRQDG